jgi:hypothetical protein
MVSEESTHGGTAHNQRPTLFFRRPPSGVLLLLEFRYEAQLIDRGDQNNNVIAQELAMKLVFLGLWGLRTNKTTKLSLHHRKYRFDVRTPVIVLVEFRPFKLIIVKHAAP